MSTPHEQQSELSVKTSRARRGFWPNLAMNLKAPPVALVLIAWLAALVILCIWGSEKLAPAGIGLLASFGAMYLVILGRTS